MSIFLIIKKYSRSKPTIIRIPPTTLMPIRLTLLFFIILFAKTNSSAPTTIIKTDINGYMSFLLSNSDLLNQAEYTTLFPQIQPRKKLPCSHRKMLCTGVFAAPVTAYCYLLKVSSFSRPSLLATQMLATASPTTFREVDQHLDGAVDGQDQGVGQQSAVVDEAHAGRGW